MNEAMILDVFAEAIQLILMLSAPMLVTALIVGLVISVFQATTQIQEQTLAFVPKVLAIFMMLMFAGPWLLNTMVTFTTELFDSIPSLIM